MATIFVASGGSNTSPYETWAKAATSLQTALTAMASGDVVVIQYNAVPSGDAERAADTTYTFNSHGALISASNDGGSAFTLTEMGASYWIGNSTVNRYVRLSAPALRVRTYGLTLRLGGSSATDVLAVNYATGGHIVHEKLYLWVSSTGAAFGSMVLGSGSTYTKLIDTTFRFGATDQYLDGYGTLDIIGGSISASGSTPATLFGGNFALLKATGFDMSLVTSTLVPNLALTNIFMFDRCKIGNGVTILAPQTSKPNKASPEVFLNDCAYGDVHGFYGHYDAQGQIETSTAVYKTTNTSGNRSWKITTTASCSYLTPFVAHAIDVYNTATASITPYLEILRDGSTTAFKDNEVWADFTAKTTTGFVTATEYADMQALSAFLAGTTGSNQAAGTGTGNWTGQGGTAWSGKIDSGSAFTPAEIGPITATIHVGAASATVYVDPEIRGL